MSPRGNATQKERIIHAAGRLFAVVSLGAGVFGAYAALELNFLAIVTAHLLAAFYGGAAGAIADRRRLGRHFFPWTVAFTIPLFGGVAAYFLLQNMKRPRTGRLFEEYAVYLDDAAAFKDSVPVMEHAAPGEPVSLGDVLSTADSEAEQRIAVEYLAEMETPQAMEILRKAASSAGSEAYFFAMTALTQMESRMLARVDELEDQIRHTGEQTADVEVLLNAASAYLDFLYYHFVAGETRTEYLRRAETLLNYALENQSAGPGEINEALLLAGRVQLALGNGKRAIKYFNNYIDSNPDRSSGYLWRAEAWHKLGKYAQLRDDCEKAGKVGDLPANMRPVIDFWLTENSAAARLPGQAGSA